MAAAESAPIYLLPDELPTDIAAKLDAERATIEPSPLLNEPSPAPELALKPVPEDPFEPIEVPLGVVDGPKIDTKSWLRNDGEGENRSIHSTVEQPRLDQNAKPAPQGDPGQGGQDGASGAKGAERADKPVDTAPAKPSEPVGPPRPEGIVQPAVAPVPAVEGSPTPEAPKSELPGGPFQPEVRAGDSGGDKPGREQTATAPRANPAATEPRREVRAVDASGAAQTPAAQSTGAAGSPGVPLVTRQVAADRDADAASVKVSAVFRNGKVEAGEGLDIRTVRPDFSLTTRALLQPRSPKMEIIFGKDGRARSVKVLKSSGFPAQVDEPVVTALYNWRAKGKVLDQLPARPDAAVSLEITIILQ